MKKFEFSPEDLRLWQKDSRGAVFFDAIRNLFSERISMMRNEIRVGDLTKSAQSEGFCEAMEEVLQLCDLLIEDNKTDKKEK